MSILDLPHEVLALILRETIRIDPASAKSFITSCRHLWLSDALSSYISKLEIWIDDVDAGKGFETMRSRVLSFLSHAYPQTLVIQLGKSSYLSGADVMYLFMQPDVAERLGRLRTLHIDGPAQPPLMLPTIQCMLDKLPCLSTLHMLCVHGERLQPLSTPFTALTSLNLSCMEVLPDTADEPTFCSVIHQSFPNLKVLTMDYAASEPGDGPYILAAHDLSSLAALEVLEIRGDFSVSVVGLNTLLTSPSSRISHLTIPLNLHHWEDGDTSQLSWSSSPLRTLRLLTPPTYLDDANMDAFLPQLLHQLPQLTHVGANYLNVFVLHEEHMSRRMANIAPFACLEGGLALFARADSPEDPADTPFDAVNGFVGVNKEELAGHLSTCLRPLQGSKFGETVIMLDFDPSILTSASVRVMAGIFPNVGMLILTYCDSPEYPKSTEPLVSMSLMVAAAVWPRLRWIEAGGWTMHGLLSGKEDPLLPFMMHMQASRRPCVISLFETSHADEKKAFGKLCTAWEERMRRSDEHSHILI